MRSARRWQLLVLGLCAALMLMTLSALAMLLNDGDGGSAKSQLSFRNAQAAPHHRNPRPAPQGVWPAPAAYVGQGSGRAGRDHSFAEHQQPELPGRVSPASAAV